MAAKIGGGGGSKFDLGQNSDMNVTPFVDVMLVLLIIFMVVAPLATVSIKLDLPPAKARRRTTTTSRRPSSPSRTTARSSFRSARPQIRPSSMEGFGERIFRPPWASPTRPTSGSSSAPTGTSVIGSSWT